jgi:hypothetical protein
VANTEYAITRQSVDAQRQAKTRRELSRIDWRHKRLGKLLIDGSLTCGKQQARVADQDKKQDITGK